MSDTPAAPRPLLQRLRARVRASDLRSLALAAVSIAVLVYAGSQAVPLGGPNAPGSLPGQSQNILEALVGDQPLPREDGYPRLKIPRLSIDLLIAQGDGKTPPAQARAWVYPGTAFPGQPGNSYMYAHSRVGAFINLHKVSVSPADDVQVDFGGGKVYHYTVTEIHNSVRYNDLSWIHHAAGTESLTLQTCDGFRDTDPRFIVVARRVS
ncbi:MAG: sortase [Candidatus Dormibacteria bacterium]